MTSMSSDYENQAREQIRRWKSPDQRWFGQTMRQIGWPVAPVKTLIGKAAAATELRSVFDKAFAGTVRVLLGAAAWTVPRKAVYARFRQQGHKVDGRAGILELDLEAVDAVVGRLDAKYTGLAFVEGAAAGAAGVPGLVADIPALLALNLRAIGEYATCYGFDVTAQRGRVFAMNVLGLASSPSDAAKAPVMAELAKIAADAAKKKAWKELKEKAFVAVVKKIAKALGIRLTKAKLAQAVPILGAAVGGGFNAYYTARVCDTAHHLYRERFLAEKYRPDVIDLTAEPAAGPGWEPRYPDADEDILRAVRSSASDDRDHRV